MNTNIQYRIFYCVFSFHVDSNSSTPVVVRSVNGQALHQLYVRYQRPYGEAILPKSDFVYITGLNQAFYVARNTLFKITFQGSIYDKGVGGLECSVQILVNNYLIIGNKTIPNTSARASYASDGSVLEIDNLNGFYQVNSGGVGILTPLTRIAYVYLPPGIYSFNVGSRSRGNIAMVYDGTVIYELLQSGYDLEGTLGEFQLITDLPK